MRRLQERRPEVERRQVIICEKAIPGVSTTALQRFLARARRAGGVKGQVHVLITDAEQMRGLNRQFRRKDKPTDVLSFPSPETFRSKFAGDLAICREIAAQNAETYGHSLADELKILMLHGVLHLGGHDHERDNGKMAKLEARLRDELKLRDNLIERTVGARPAARSKQAGKGAAKKAAKKAVGTSAGTKRGAAKASSGKSSGRRR